MMFNETMLIIWLILGAIAIFSIVLILILYGKLITLQIKIRFLARRGYHLVEHIGINKVRTYFYLKPTNNKFDFRSGFYIHYSEVTTKISSVIPNTPNDYTFKKIDKLDDQAEIKRLEETVSKLVYNMDAVTLRWGIPIITYVGNSPFPINFQEPKSEYGAQVIRDVYIRLLATEQYGFMRKMMIIGLIVMVCTIFALILLYFAYNSSASNTALCLHNLNSTAENLVMCVSKDVNVSAVMV